MSHLTGLLTVAVGLALAATASAAAPVLRPLGSGDGRTFARQEWAVDLGGATFDNPFDPDRVAVDATFTGPGGRTLVVPAFYDERPGFKGFIVRMVPDAAGAWRGTVTVTEPAGAQTSAEVAFTAADSGSPGFVRAAANRRYLRFDDGTGYFPVGINLCWPNGGGGAAWYETAFDTLAKHGGNYARVWMSNNPTKLEGAETGLGRYGLAAAAYYDAVLDAADRRGVRVMLCFLNHREFLDHDMWGKCDWPTLPYNAARGGPATRPADVFTDAAARRAFRNRLRYIVARYSAFTSVGFWELFNEQENARVPIPTAWNGEMSAYLAKVDPYRHIVTTSATVPDAVWQLPDMGLTQAHLYGDGSLPDMVPPVTQAARDHDRFAKPFLVGEIGLDFQGPDTREDPKGLGTAFHNSLWSALASGSAGSAVYWWWDNYVEPKNLWHEYAPVAAFAKTVDWANRDFRPIAVDEAVHADATGGPVDLVLLPAGGWGDTTHGPIAIPPSGHPQAAPPRYLYGPGHKGLSQPLTFDLTVPPACRLKVGVAQVSDCAVVRVSVDGEPVRDFFASALPTMPGVTHAARRKADGDMYQSTVDQEFAVDLPTGHHAVTVTIPGGDWATLAHVTFTAARPAKYADLAAMGVQDAASSEAVVWLRDERSNWQADRDGTAPPADQANVEVTIPHVAAGDYACHWFDTRTGRATESRVAAAAAGPLTVKVPPFTRDIALRLAPVGPPAGVR